MAALTSRVPPAGLWDRLRHEGRTVRTEREYRDAVTRDLQDLLGTTRHWSPGDFSESPAVAYSVLNFGVPSITGRVVTIDSAEQLARDIRSAILRFDRRFDSTSTTVCVGSTATVMDCQAVPLVIESTLGGFPTPVPFSATAIANFDSGHIEVTQSEHNR